MAAELAVCSSFLKWNHPKRRDDFLEGELLFIKSKAIIFLKIANMKILLLNLGLMLLLLPAFSQRNTRVVFTINLHDSVQKIRNIGASACWFGEEIGKKWPADAKQRMAEVLFSRAFENNGQPKGIGLSAFRFNIGAGTAEQGDSSGIKNPAHRVECFLSPQGKYDWSKQQGYIWLLKQAKKQGVKDLIAFVNSPPVQFTKNGLGYKLRKDEKSNLQENKYADYAGFLSTVVRHFDKINCHFNYISPVNEPQWDWSGTFGEAKQEGSPWTNEEIYKTVKALNKGLQQQKATTKILITEAGMLNHLYDSNVKASRQIARFWDPGSDLYIGNLSHATPFVEGHGYFTDNGDDNLISVRNKLKDTLKKYGAGLEYWQSEYCMLGDGFKENVKDIKRSAMDCALFLAKVIHQDFTAGNATAWHFWNAFEPGAADSNTQYYLVALNALANKDSAKLYTITKNLWALGHYSLFVRPGMYRLQTSRSDGLSETAAARQVMVSAFKDDKTLVVNVINYTIENTIAGFVPEGLPNAKKMKLVKRYVTTAAEGEDMMPYPVENTQEQKPGEPYDVIFPARSVTTLLFSF
jgi:O-glycosyl hydrolase